MNQRVVIIAEAGVNHNGDLEKAIALVDAAADCGADVIKFQTFSAERLTSISAPKAGYQKRSTDEHESQQEMLKRLELSREQHIALINHSNKKGIRFLSTGFDIQSIDFLIALGIAQIKIPSGEITNLPYLRHIGALGKKIILSTGMASLGEVEDAINALEFAGTPRAQLTVLHCNTEYPTPMADVNLRAMAALADAFKVSVGYSDHTLGIEVPIAAVALGAVVIEKHLTLDRTLPGPDQATSLMPSEFREMVNSIRNIEVALGDGIKRPSASEAANKSIARKSLVASKFIAQGELLSADNVATKRPGSGISPMRWDEVIGRTAKRSYSPDDLIEL